MRSYSAKKVVALDLEVRSALDIKKVDIQEYTRHPSTRVLVAGWCMQGKPPEAWTYKDKTNEKLLELNKLLQNPNTKIVCHNAEYDISVWDAVMCRHHPEVQRLSHPKNWSRMYDTMAIAKKHNLPTKLEFLSQRILGRGKDERGGDLINFFCMPKTKEDGRQVFQYNEEKFRAFVRYCKTDTRLALFLFFELIKKYGDIPEDNVLSWIYIALNNRGVTIDTELCNILKTLHEENLETLSAELEELTDGKIKTPNQVKAMTEYLRTFPELKDLKGVSEKVLAELDIKDPTARRIIEIRKLAAGRGATMKTLLKNVQRDGILRHYIRHQEANSNRCTSKGFNIQNLPRPTMEEAKCPEATEEVIKHLKNGDTMGNDAGKIIKSFMRGVIVAKPGNKLVAVDFSGLEYRLINYFAKDFDKLEKIKEGGTTQFYMAMARDITGKKEIDKNSEDYILGKTATLALGYMMGVKKFYTQYSDIYKDEDLAKKASKVYRQQHEKIVHQWHRIGQAIASAPIVTAGGSRHTRKSMSIRTISGRRIEFKNIRRVWKLFDVEQEDGSIQKVKRLVSIYDNWNSKTRTFNTDYIHGGKVTSYYCQGSAADIVDSACLSVYNKLGLIPILNVHDELVYEVPEDYDPEAIKEAMLDLPEWCDLPLDADYWEAKRYGKF